MIKPITIEQPVEWGDPMKNIKRLAKNCFVGAGFISRHDPDEAKRIRKQYWGTPDETRDATDY